MKKLRGLIYGLAEIIFGLNWGYDIDLHDLSSDTWITAAIKIICFVSACIFIFLGVTRSRNNL